MRLPSAADLKEGIRIQRENDALWSRLYSLVGVAQPKRLESRSQSRKIKPSKQTRLLARAARVRRVLKQRSYGNETRGTL
jgi:hypothetical protein